jgi:cytoskeleton protein RodZ
MSTNMSTKTLDVSQIEQLKQIASYLATQRQEKKIPLEKIAKETFIPLRLLQALESNQFERLPEPVYIRGFIRRYADSVGLDGNQVANGFQVEPAPLSQPAVPLAEPRYAPMPAPIAPAAPASAPAPVSQPATSTVRSTTPITPSSTPLSSVAPSPSSPLSPPEPIADRVPPPIPYEQREIRDASPGFGRYLPWLGAGIAAVVVGAIAANTLVKPDPTPQAVAPSPVAPPVEPSVSPSASPSSPEALAPDAAPTTEASPSLTADSPSPNPTLPADGASPSLNDASATVSGSGPVQVDLNITDRAWVQVVTDGNVEFEGILDKGTQRTWKAKERVVVYTGNAGGVTTSLNQGEAKAIGKPGEVGERSFP